MHTKTLKSNGGNQVRARIPLRIWGRGFTLIGKFQQGKDGMTMKYDRVMLTPCACEPAETPDEFRLSVELCRVSYTHSEATLAPCSAARRHALAEYGQKSISYAPRTIVDRHVAARGCQILNDLGRG